jgi:hypothetical protein
MRYWLILCVVLPFSARAGDWFRSSPTELCKEVPKPKACSKPRQSSDLPAVAEAATGGGKMVQFINKKSKVEFATYSSGPDKCANQFRIGNLDTDCERFFVKVQAYQQKCHGCLLVNELLEP